MLHAPFPYFGGKRRAAPIVWAAFGEVKNYVEPFFGSGAVLLERPDWQPGMTETVNDIDGYLANFWRAVKADPEQVAHHADWPVNEVDLHARHAWLVNAGERVNRQMGDPDWYDAKIAGWWVWGACAWIGSGWCSGRGPWRSVDGVLVRDGGGQGINRQLPHLGDRGRGINRQLPHLGNRGQGINRQLPHLGNRGEFIREWFARLSERLRDVRVCCGDWQRVLGPSPTTRLGLTGVFLDPPYADTAGRAGGLYSHDSLSVAHDVREWATAHGDNPKLRIVLAGLDGEHAMPGDWICVDGKTGSGVGYGGQRKAGLTGNHKRERLWLSPHCVRPENAEAVA